MSEFKFFLLHFSHALILWCSFQVSALKSANKELKGMMKTVKIQDIDVCSLSIPKPLFLSCLYGLSIGISWESWWTDDRCFVPPPPFYYLSLSLCRTCKMRWWTWWMLAVKFKRPWVEATACQMILMRKISWVVSLRSFKGSIQFFWTKLKFWFAIQPRCLRSKFFNIV